MQLGPPNLTTYKTAYTGGQTYYVDIGIGAAITQSVHLLGDGTFVGTIRFYSTNYDDVDTNSTTSGHWFDESSAIADVTVNASTVGQMVHIGNCGARRMRIRITCATTGKLGVAVHGRA